MSAIDRPDSAFPRQKRRARFRAIEQELYTYERSAQELADLAAAIDDEANPIRSIWPTIGERIDMDSAGKEIRILGVLPGGNGQVSDPTADRAEHLQRWRHRHLGSLEYREMVRSVTAVERVLRRLEESEDAADKLKLRLIEEKYFRRRLTDEGICQELNIALRTFYKYRREIIEEIARELGWVV